MSKIPPTPVEVWSEGSWHRGTLHSCEVTPNGTSCSGVVAWESEYTRTARFPAEQMRTLSGELGCPAPHTDSVCGSRIDEATLQPIHHVYEGPDREACEVEVNGTWHLAEIHSWDRDESGAWSACVMWSTGPGNGNRLARFPADRVRPA